MQRRAAGRDGRRFAGCHTGLRRRRPDVAAGIAFAPALRHAPEHQQQQRDGNENRDDDDDQAFHAGVPLKKPASVPSADDGAPAN
ncbi:MAG TPA: hypothetical protein VJ724_08895 [Tahibacter sp.]|nr:hypothetical protein [Tahibacter sp.]